MAQSLEVNIKTTSDLPQAMDKAKAATTSFQNQLDSIGKKFSTAFKDIALGFIAPVIILQTAISFISAAIAKAKQEAKEAYDFAVKGESKYLDPATVNLARDRRAREDDAKEQEMAKTAREKETEEELKREGMRNKIAGEIGGWRGFALRTGIDANSAEAMSKEKDVQDAVARLKYPNGTAQNDGPKVPTGPTSFKPPEGFGNIVGVGANPVIEAMTMQLEEARKQTAILETISTSSGNGGGVPADFTKSPYRATPYGL